MLERIVSHSFLSEGAFSRVWSWVVVVQGVGERLSVGCQRASQSLRTAPAPETYAHPSLIHVYTHNCTSLSPSVLCITHYYSLTLTRPQCASTPPLISASVSSFTPCSPWYKHATMPPAAAHPAYLSELSCYAVVTPTYMRA